MKEELVASQRSLQKALLERDARKNQLVTKIKEGKVCRKTSEFIIFYEKASQLQERLRFEAERREGCKNRLSRPRCRADVEKEVEICQIESSGQKCKCKGESKAGGS